MSTIKLHDKYFKPYISKEKIEQTVQRMVKEIAKDCKDETPIFIGILNGCFIYVLILLDYILKTVKYHL